MVVHDDQVRLHGAASHLGDEAAAIIRTCAAQAGLRPRIELVPQGARLRQPRKLGAVAGFGRALPFRNLLVLVDLVQSRQNRLVAQRVELAAAKIVAAALHVADAQFAQQSLEKRHVAKEKLVLQGLGSRGNNHALPGAQSRQQVGQSFSGARARFHNQMPSLGECALHSLGHLVLPRPVLVRQRRVGQNAARRKKLVKRGQGAGWGVGGGHLGRVLSP